MSYLRLFRVPVLFLIMLLGATAYDATPAALADAGRALGPTAAPSAPCSVNAAIAPLIAAWETGYNPVYDLNSSGRIDVGDIVLQINQTLESCTTRSPLGLQMFWDDIQSSAARDKAAEAGARWVRLPSGWYFDGNFSSLDSMVGAVIEAGLEPIIVLGNSPTGARAGSQPNNGCGPIKTSWLPIFDAKVQQLAERYDGDGVDDAPGHLVVDNWEFWNEPDQISGNDWVGGCWGGDRDLDGRKDSYEYADMLKVAYPAVKAANPNAKVLLGALAMENTGLFNTSFLDEVLSQGGAAYFDYTNVHQYDFQRDAWDGALPWNQGILGKIAAVKAKVDKPVVVSEIGLKRDVTGEQQARHLVHEMVRGMSLPAQDVKALIWFLLVDEASNPSGDYGLLARNTLTPFPAYYAYRTLAQEFTDVDYQVPADQLGPGETGSNYIQAYRFTLQDGTTKLALWTDDGVRISLASDRHINMAIGAAELGGAWTGQLRVVDSTEYPTVTADIISDNGPGDLDSITGQITLLIKQDPIYVEAVP